MNNNPWEVGQNANDSCSSTEQEGDVDLDDNDDDGVPLIEEIVDDNEIFCRPSATLREDISIDDKAELNLEKQDSKSEL